MRLLKSYYWHIAYLIVVPVAVIAVLFVVGWRAPQPEEFRLPEDYCVAVAVPDPEHRALAVRYGIPVTEKSPYTLVVARPIAFGRRGYTVEMGTVLPIDSEVHRWRAVVLRATGVHETQDAAMKEAAEWWAGCR